MSGIKEYSEMNIPYDDVNDDAIECPNCKAIALIVIHHASDYDEMECMECGHYQTMGTQHE